MQPGYQVLYCICKLQITGVARCYVSGEETSINLNMLVNWSITLICIHLLQWFTGILKTYNHLKIWAKTRHCTQFLIMMLNTGFFICISFLCFCEIVCLSKVKVKRKICPFKNLNLQPLIAAMHLRGGRGGCWQGGGDRGIFVACFELTEGSNQLAGN